MKLLEFDYLSKKNELTHRRVAVVFETETRFNGVDLDKLTPEEEAKFRAIQLKYESDLKPFMQHYRHFIYSSTDNMKVDKLENK